MFIKEIEKQGGIATIAIVLLVVLGVGLLGGGTFYLLKNNKNQERGSKNAEIEESQGQIGNQNGFQFDESLLGTAEDLVIGKKVGIQGIENEDGSITANLILVGEFEDTEFQERPNQMNFDEEFQNQEEFQNRERQAPPEGMSEGINPEGFMNLSPEEMEQQMGNFPNGGEMSFVGGGGSRTRGGASAVSGEIINKDETSITIKIEEGGSKLIFYSEDTRIFVNENETQESE